MTEHGSYPDFFNENPGDFIRERRMHYLMVNTIARRVRQLQLGERPLSSVPDGNRDPIRVAVQELLEDQLEVTPRVHQYEEEDSEPITEID